MRCFPSLGLCGVALLFAVGCVSLQPHLGTGGSAPQPDHGGIGPTPTPTAMPGPAGRPVIDQICRSHPRPSGYIAIAYTVAGERCPRNTDPENEYNGAVIERHAARPVGSIMIVCADQGLPSGWTREHSRKPATGCTGARVRDGRPTAVTIRRVR